MTPRAKGVLIGLVGTTFWATTGIFISYLLNHYTLQPLTLAFWRDLIVALGLILGLRLVQPQALRIARRDVGFFLAYGFVGLAAFNGMWTFSVKYNGAAVATVLAYSSPAFIVLLARPILKEPLSARKLIAVALSLTGCVLVVKAYTAETWQLNPIGIAVGLGTGLAFAIYSLAGKWSARRFPSPWTVTAYGFLFAAGGLGLANLFAQPSQAFFSLGQAWDGWLILAILALVPTVAGFGLYTLSLRYLPAGVAGLIASLEPVLTAIMAIFLLGEWLDGWQWLGAGLILAAVLLAQTEAEQRAPQAGRTHQRRQVDDRLAPSEQRMNSMPLRRSLILLGVVVLLIAGAAFYFWQARRVAQQAAQAALQQEVVRRGTITSTVSATGFLAPDNQVNLYFSTASVLPVEEVNVVLGQKVRRGEMLARLDSQDLELGVTEVELALQAARLGAAQLQAPPRPEDIAVAEANLRVAQAQVYAASQGNSPQAVEIARLNLLVAQNTLDRTHKQMDILVEEGGDLGWLAKNAFLQPRADQQVLAAKTADEQYHAAQAAPGFGNAASALAAVEQAQVALDRLKSGPPPEDLKIAQLRVDQAQAALEVAQHNLATAQILAPFDGVVTAVNIRPGELTASAVPAIVLADVNTFFLDVAVDEVDVARVALGQAVTVTLDALPNALLTGKVEKIALIATNSATGVVSYGVRVLLDPTQALVRGGMTATAEIVVAEARDVVLVPNWAIRRDREKGLTYVGILRNGVLEEVEVRLGLHNETYSEVVSGLAENDVVAVDTTREQFRLVGGGQ